MGGNGKGFSWRDILNNLGNHVPMRILALFRAELPDWDYKVKFSMLPPELKLASLSTEVSDTISVLDATRITSRLAAFGVRELKWIPI